jgi:tyrosyl-tRNA synthetase
MGLAFTITEEYNGTEAAEKARDEFINVVSNKGLPEDIPEITGAIGKNILDLLVELDFAASKGEAKRLIQGGGVKIDNEKLSDINYTFEKSVLLQAGKRKFAKICHCERAQ